MIVMDSQHNLSKPPIPANEQERLDALYSYQLFDELDKEKYQAIVDLASAVCDTPIALVTLISADLQIFKAKKGIDADTTSREDSFCAHSFSNPHQPFIIEDARKDIRFVNNPLVNNDPNIAFYAGIPLLSNEQYPMGTLCVIDSKPRTLTEHQLSSLKILSKHVVLLFEQRKNLLELKEKKQLLEQTVKDLDHIAVMIAHDLKSAFRRIGITTEILQLKHEDDLDEESQDFLNNIIQETEDSSQFTTAILKLAKSIHSYNEKRVDVDLKELIQNSCEKLSIPESFEINLPEEAVVITAPISALRHIFENLIQNSVKYTDKAAPQIDIDYTKKQNHHHIKVADNGPGIEEKFRESIFKMFNRGKFNAEEVVPGTGIGLSIVYKIVNLLGGTIDVASNSVGGATFYIKLPVDN